MILNLFENPIFFIFAVIALVVAITVHEASHAKMADYLGDPTPRLQGRVTLNPLSHLDLVGSLFILLVGFGWGKPVEFDPYNLRNKKKDSVLISLAGPMSNFLIAVLSSLILYSLFFLNLNMPVISSFLAILIQLNLMLGVFNLVPIHPLDGFKIVEGLLSNEQAVEWRKLERFGFIFLLLFIFPIGNGSIFQNVLSPLIAFIYRFLIP